MDRTLSCLSIFALLLVAVGICVMQTIKFSEHLDGTALAVLFSAEAGVAGMLIVSFIWLLHRRFARTNKPVTRRPVAAIVRV